MRRRLITTPNDWEELNTLVMSLGEVECSTLLEVERTGRRRLMWLLRIHSRINRLRAIREREELRRIAR